MDITKKIYTTNPNDGDHLSLTFALPDKNVSAIIDSRNSTLKRRVGYEIGEKIQLDFDIKLSHDEIRDTQNITDGIFKKGNYFTLFFINDDDIRLTEVKDGGKIIADLEYIDIDTKRDRGGKASIGHYQIEKDPYGEGTQIVKVVIDKDFTLPDNWYGSVKFKISVLGEATSKSYQDKDNQLDEEIERVEIPFRADKIVNDIVESAFYLGAFANKVKAQVVWADEKTHETPIKVTLLKKESGTVIATKEVSIDEKGRYITEFDVTEPIRYAIQVDPVDGYRLDYKYHNFEWKYTPHHRFYNSEILDYRDLADLLAYYVEQEELKFEVVEWSKWGEEVKWKPENILSVTKNTSYNEFMRVKLNSENNWLHSVLVDKYHYDITGRGERETWVTKNNYYVKDFENPHGFNAVTRIDKDENSYYWKVTNKFYEVDRDNEVRVNLKVNWKANKPFEGERFNAVLHGITKDSEGKEVRMQKYYQESWDESSGIDSHSVDTKTWLLNEDYVAREYSDYGYSENLLNFNKYEIVFPDLPKDYTVKVVKNEPSVKKASGYDWYYSVLDYEVDITSPSTGGDNSGGTTGGDNSGGTTGGDNGSGITDGGDNGSGTTGGSDNGSGTTGGDNNSGTTPVDVVNPVIPPIIITPDEVDPPVVLPTTVDVVTTPEVAITLPELPLEEDIDIDGDSTPRGDADLDIDVLEDENPRGKANIKDGNRTKKKNASTGMAGKILAKTGGLNNFFAKALMVLAGLSLMLGLTAFRKKED